MRKCKIYFIIFNIIVSSYSVSQTGTSLIYDSGDLGISQFQSFKYKNIAQRQIYIQLNCSVSPPPPNFTGVFKKLNRSYNYCYIPFNDFLNSHWVYEGFNGFWSCNPVGCFVVSPNDSNFIIKHSDEIVSDCCGYVQVNKVTWNSGSNYSNSVEVPDYSGFCGMDIDTTIEILDEAVYFYAYKMKYSFNNTVNSIIKVLAYSWTDIEQEITDTIPSLKSFTNGGFLKVNPFKRNYIFTVGDHMMLSTTSGTDFFSINIPPVKKLIFSDIDRRIYGFTSSKLYSSSNNGISWDSLNIPYSFNTIESNPYNANILYGGADSGMYISVNKGLSWALYNNSFTPSRKVIGISKDNNSSDTVLVCTDKAIFKVWDSFIVGIRTEESKTTQNFTLFQNYPNPFNPVTKIKFDIPSKVKGQTSNVKLIIYDALGKELQVLVNERLNAGSYEMEFNGNNFASGVYFYKLEAGDFVETKRMILLK